MFWAKNDNEELFNKTKNENDSLMNKTNHLKHILNSIEDRYDIIYEKTISKYCEKIYFLFDDLIEAFQETSKYLYVTPYQNLNSDDSDDSDDSDEFIDEETEEMNPNLVYDNSKKDN